MRSRVIVMGGSAGGPTAMGTIIASLPLNFLPPILLVNHIHAGDNGAFAEYLGQLFKRSVIEASDKQIVQECGIYSAPANYHLLVERDGSLALSVDERVNWSRPSIDVLLESAANVWSNQVIGVILSGANSDGTLGMAAIQAAGGYTIAQDPHDAESPRMPESAIAAGAVNEILPLSAIASRLVRLCSI